MVFQKLQLMELILVLGVSGTLYKLSKNSGSWDADVDENVITITNPSHEC